MNSGIYGMQAYKLAMKNTNYNNTGRTDFEEFGKRIGLPEKVIKREIDRFTKENPLIDKLINHSFLSDNLKKQYRMSTDYRRKMLIF